MNDSVTAPTIGQALAWAIQRLGEEWRMVLVLSVLMLAVFLAAFSPFFSVYAALIEYGVQIQSNPDLMNPTVMAQNQPDIEMVESPGIMFLFLIVVMLAGGSTIYVLMSRLTDMAPGMLLEGGFGALAKRTLWTIWRLICFTGWILLMGLVWMLLMVFLMPLIGLSSGLLTALEDPSNIAGAMKSMIIGMAIIYVLLITVMMAIYSALSISVYAASRDVRIGILASWNALKGCRLRLTIINMIIYFALIAVYFLTGMLLEPYFLDLNWTVILVFYAGFLLLTGIQIFLWLTVGAAFANYALSGRHQPS